MLSKPVFVINKEQELPGRVDKPLEGFHAKIDVQDGKSKLIVAEDLRQKLGSLLGRDLQILGSFEGSALEGIRYANPLSKQDPALDRESPVVIGGDYITTEAGTGLVHTAPGHGHEDFQVCFVAYLHGPFYGLHLQFLQAFIRSSSQWHCSIQNHTFCT